MSRSGASVEQEASWLALRSVPGMTAPLFSRLVELVGGPETLRRTSLSRLEVVQGVSPGMAERIRGGGDVVLWRDRLAALEKEGIGLLVWGEAGYPEVLLQGGPRFPLLFFRGEPGVLAVGQGVGFLGASVETEAALELALWLGGQLARAGIGVLGQLGKATAAAGHGGSLENGGWCAAVATSGLGLPLRGKVKEHASAVGQRGVICSTVVPDERASRATERDALALIVALSAAIVILGPEGDPPGFELGREILREGKPVFVAGVGGDKDAFLRLVTEGALPLPPAPGFGIEMIVRELGTPRRRAVAGQLDLFG
jgi:DNA processing protein